MLSDADPASEGQTPQTSEGTGSIAAIDQMAGWARFGDTKATILAAGLGVAATMFNSSAPAVFKAMSRPCPAGLLVGGFALLTVLSFMWTLFWVVRAIAPRSDIPYQGLNRFAWPSVADATAERLVRHDQAKVAKRKFYFCRLAVYGFGVTIASGVVTVLLSALYNSSIN